jgi:hypothetical protein
LHRSGDQETDWRGSLGRRVDDRARGALHGRASSLDKGRQLSRTQA